MKIIVPHNSKLVPHLRKLVPHNSKLVPHLRKLVPHNSKMKSLYLPCGGCLGQLFT